MIDRQTETAVKSDGFATIERSLLEAVVLRDSLSVKEVDLFKAVDSWAAKQCQKQGSSTDGESKRKILGERIVKSIRFPVMKQEEFAAVVIDAKILTPDEIFTFFKFFSSTLTSPVGFPETRRSGIYGTVQRCGRFQSMALGIWRYTGNKDRLDISMNKDIILHGLCLCGSESNDYSVTLEIKNTNKNSRVASKSGTFSSKPLQYKNDNYHGFKVLFDPPVNLKNNT